MATTTYELRLKIGHTNDATTTLTFNGVNPEAAETMKSKILMTNSGTINVNGQTLTVDYQPFLVTKSGAVATKITEATFTKTERTNIYTYTPTT